MIIQRRTEYLDTTATNQAHVFAVGEMTSATIQVANPNAVTWSTAVLTVEVSIDGENYHDPVAGAVTISAVGLAIVDVVDYDYLRVRVSTVETSGGGDLFLVVRMTDAVHVDSA